MKFKSKISMLFIVLILVSMVLLLVNVVNHDEISVCDDSSIRDANNMIQTPINLSSEQMFRAAIKSYIIIIMPLKYLDNKDKNSNKYGVSILPQSAAGVFLCCHLFLDDVRVNESK